MYQPAPHRVDNLALQHAFIRANPLGLLITNGPGGLMANPVPFHLHAGDGERGVLRAHIARANPQWREANEGREALIAFQHPGAYISPFWYATKRETGEVVPTWNYVCVQVRGELRAIDDRIWLRAQIDALTAEREAAVDGEWSAADAPEDYIDRMMTAVVGLELRISSIEGKWKVSQNRTLADREGAARGLRALGDDASNHMAKLIDTSPRC